MPYTGYFYITNQTNKTFEIITIKIESGVYTESWSKGSGDDPSAFKPINDWKCGPFNAVMAALWVKITVSFTIDKNSGNFKRAEIKILWGRDDDTKTGNIYISGNSVEIVTPSGKRVKTAIE